MTATFQRATRASCCRDDSIVTQACVRPNACYHMNLRRCRQIVRVCVRSVSSPLAVVWEGVPIRTEINLIRAVKPCSCSPCDLSVNWARFAWTVALSFLCKCTLRGCREKSRLCLKTAVYSILVSVWTIYEAVCLFYCFVVLTNSIRIQCDICLVYLHRHKITNYISFF